MKTNSLFLIFCIGIQQLLFAGFAPGTMIHVPTGRETIEDVALGDRIISFSQGVVTERVVHKRVINLNQSVKVCLPCDELIVSVDQTFFLHDGWTWKQAQELVAGDLLFTVQLTPVEVKKIEFIHDDQTLYELTVQRSHTLVIGDAGVVVHNAFPVIIGLSWAFGSGAIEFAGATLGLGVLGTWLGVKLKKYADEYDDIPYVGDVGINFEDSSGEGSKGKKEVNDESERDDGAQAPGKPTKEDGYKPPKKWNGEKVRHPKSGQYGWPDDSGGVWVSTGKGSRAHRGPHWDVIDKKGKHRNVLPGGRKC